MIARATSPRDMRRRPPSRQGCERLTRARVEPSRHPAVRLRMVAVRSLFLAVALGASTLFATAPDNLRLESFAYPFPVQTYRFSSQQQEVEMAYIDLKTERENAEAVVLLHGKNFSSAYWEQTA